jgi:hypothetical protein
MYTLQAPFPTIECTTTLPDANLNDSTSNNNSFNTIRSMNGTKRTYIKEKGRRIINLTFTLTRLKALELQAFMESYYYSQVALTDHRGQTYVGYFQNNPFETQVSGRAAGSPGHEFCDVTVQFEGTLNA